MSLGPLHIAVYGLSTEGYRIASSIAMQGRKVSLIDESARMAIALKPDVARNYPDVNSLIEDEPLLSLDPIDIAISTASYIFFAPKIRKTGQEVKSDVTSKFMDAIKYLKKDSSIVYALPTGIGGNHENIALIEHMTGMNVGSDVHYYYMPVGISDISSQEILIGSIRSRQDIQIEKLLYERDSGPNLNFVDIVSAELVHSIRVLGRYTGMASIFEICKHVRDNNIGHELMSRSFSDLYLDDAADGLYDLRAIASSLSGAGPLMYLVNGTIKGTEGYIKHLIDETRDILKKRDIKASRTKVVIAWTLDWNEMRGDKIDLMLSLESKLKDYISDVEIQRSPALDLYPTDKTTIVIACSRADYMKITTKRKLNSDYIVVNANPICGVVY